MSSATTIDFQIENMANLEKIERFMNQSTYQQNVEYSANFNTQLCVERRLRLPFFDSQTGVAQNHCSLFMTRRQRMPGFREGQLYTYPATRWRKHGRQYLTKMLRPRPFSALPSATSTTSNSNNNNNSISIGSHTNHHRRTEPIAVEIEPDMNSGGASIFEESSSLGGAAGDTSDSKDSQTLKEELPREWFYDDMDLNEIDALDEPKSPPDDEYDYDPRYGAKKRKRRGKSGGGTRSRSSHANDSPRKSRSGGGGGGSGSAAGATSAARGGRSRKSTRSSARKTNKTSQSMFEPPSFETAAAAVEKYF